MIVARRRWTVIGITAIGLSMRRHGEAECAHGERKRYESVFHLQFLIRMLPTRRHCRQYLWGGEIFEIVNFGKLSVAWRVEVVKQNMRYARGI